MNPRGFIALTSVLILSVVLLTIVIGAGMRNFYARFDALDTEFKAESEELARSCLDAVLLRFATHPEYTGGESLSIEETTCDVGIFEVDDTEAHATVSVEYRHAVTTYDVSIDIRDLSIIALREIPNISP